MFIFTEQNNIDFFEDIWVKLSENVILHGGHPLIADILKFKQFYLNLESRLKIQGWPAELRKLWEEYGKTHFKAYVRIVLCVKRSI